MGVQAVANNVKIRLRSGAREIEIEGTKEDVDELLTSWWANEDRGPGDATPTDANAASKIDTKPKLKKRARRLPQAPKPSVEGEIALFDTNKIANDIKEDKRFALIQEKIIHGKADYYNKSAFVCWYLNEALTSGQIHKVLLALHIKIDLPRVSEALKKNIGNFITSGKRERGAKASTYRLTSWAHAEFEKWLLSDEA